MTDLTTPEPEPDPGPIVPSGGEESSPTIDPERTTTPEPRPDEQPDPGDPPTRDPDPEPDPAERGLAHRDEDQAEVDREMS